MLQGNPLLSKIEPQAFVGLSSLLELNITEAGVTELADNTFYGLTKLQTLEFTRNRLNVVSSTAFRGLEALVFVSRSLTRHNVFHPKSEAISCIKRINLGYGL